ncbi:TonB-linked outer membrane protein, SusC/RagA family [Parapedobacter indicus]|uniref:TonB-linked outer membrane protein, SusC/RagA family n=2 Tax=Parapedobacter indicus TaxID=1477437 RepID=A0A1I3F3V3_9SPHI|nr:TonB-linked SusC/RagA family outer membrane protein [Parapedobacter indicus]SFI05471.1 TonB-linked outer membrane protein, SusC/RagA family [Parapedobacter indicus]
MNSICIHQLCDFVRLIQVTTQRVLTKKTVLIMKLAYFFVAMIVLQTHATSYGQTVSISVVNVPLKTALQQVKAQSGYAFFFNDELLKKTKPVSLHVSDVPVKEVLDQLFAGQPVDYQLIDNIISVLPKRELSKLKTDAMIGQLYVSGTVRDERDSALAGVSIHVFGGSGGTITDGDGQFKLEVPDLMATLIFSFVGYQTQEVNLVGRMQLSIHMVPEENQLDEVVVGYAVQKRENVTGAVDVISNKQLQNRQSPTVSQLLQGQSPGLSFSASNSGFNPGAELSIDIRGVGSLNGGAPLVVIDGIPGDMNRLNPQDIESISVLKDAAASAIYGARAPYGVILITTKSGAKDETISISYSGNVTHATPQRLPEMLDSYTYARVMNEAGVNGGGRVHTNAVVDRIIAFQRGDIDYIKQFTIPEATFFETVPLTNGTWGFNQNSNADYDWFDEYYGNSLNQQHNISVQGGSKSTSYYFSAGRFDQGSVLNYGTDTYNRTNLMGKISTSLTKWWDFTYQPRFMKSIRMAPNVQGGEDYSIIFHQIARTRPNSAKYDGYGNLMVTSSKIPWVNDAGTNSNEITENIHNFATVIRPLRGWDINMDFAYRAVDVFGTRRSLTVYEHDVNNMPYADAQTTPNWIQQNHQSANYWTYNLYTSYRFTLDNRHNFTILGGYQAELNRQKSLTVRKSNLLVQDVLSLETAIGDPTATESLTHWATEGYFGRLTYNFEGKYLAEFNVRYDGTSRFRFANRWGTFPSLAVGWNIHKESFWTGVDNVINSFKLRGSWGALGNQNVSPYQDLNLIPLQSTPLNWIFGYGQSRPIGYAATPLLVSPDLRWETATTRNIGADISFLSDRLQGTFDWFDRVTTDMIGPAEAQPGVLGAALPQANNSTLKTKGWELSVRWNHQVNERFSYFANATLYDSRMFVTKYLNPTGLLSTWYNGKEQGEIWGYTAYDLFRTNAEAESYAANADLDRIWGGAWRAGDLKYEDLNGDGAVNNGANTLADHGDYRIIGNSTPRYQFGLSAGATFGGFDFSILLKGTAKRDLFFGADENVFWGFVQNATQSSPFINHLDYFRGEEGDVYTGLNEGVTNINTDAYWPRPYLNAEGAKNKAPSTRYLQSGAYLRIQNVQFGYHLPSRIASKLHLQTVRMYLSGENLFTFTNLSPAIDPVALDGNWGAGKTYGADRMLSFGLTITY